jgi:hypothetical protein
MRGWLLTVVPADSEAQHEVLIVALNDVLTFGLDGTMRQEFPQGGKITAQRELSEPEALALWRASHQEAIPCAL